MRYSEEQRGAKADEPLLISVEEASRMLNMDPWSVRELCVSKQLRAGKPGGRKWRISPDSVREYAERITSGEQAS